MLIKARFRFSEVFFGMLLAVAIFALGAAFWSLNQSQGNQQNATISEQETNKTSEANSKKTQSLWVPTDSVGLYTLVLSVFTGVLAGVSIFQGIMLLRADKTTRIAADAALLNAKAAIGVELPIIIFRLSLNREPGVHGPIIDIPGKTSTLVIQFWNRGRSAAEMAALYVETIVVSSLPETAIFNEKIFYAPGHMLEPSDDQYNHGQIETRPVNIIDEQIEAIKNGTQSPWAYGYLLYY
jgi:hypothetical protein